eukprot:PLAT7596.1.p1 GENE.PLAT7596.1~~PLAT7596.1.p1  ORF type:complete len:277 (-),score=102.28 PLAT7596.1:136-858(-)
MAEVDKRLATLRDAPVVVVTAGSGDHAERRSGGGGWQLDSASASSRTAGVDGSGDLSGAAGHDSMPGAAGGDGAELDLPVEGGVEDDSWYAATFKEELSTLHASRAKRGVTGVSEKDALAEQVASLKRQLAKTKAEKREQKEQLAVMERRLKLKEKEVDAWRADGEEMLALLEATRKLEAARRARGVPTAAAAGTADGKLVPSMAGSSSSSPLLGSAKRDGDDDGDDGDKREARCACVIA